MEHRLLLGGQMVFEKFTSKIKEATSDVKAQYENKKADEVARKGAIASGEIEPIQVVVNLEPGELAYASFPAKKMGDVETQTQTTVGSTKKKGVVKRGAVGMILAGPVGGVLGAATASNTSETATTTEISRELKQLDKGQLIFTSRRVVFVGQGVVSLPYDQVVAVTFKNGLTGATVSLKYDGMSPNEHYILSGGQAKDSELYYRSIQNHLIEK